MGFYSNSQVGESRVNVVKNEWFLCLVFFDKNVYTDGPYFVKIISNWNPILQGVQKFAHGEV